MADYGFTITFNPSLEEVISKFRSINFESFLEKKIKEVAFMVMGESRRVTPIDTGRLRSSIGIQGVRPLTIIVGPHTEYDVFVHEGTRYMRARPFMRWGAEKTMTTINRNLANELDTYIQDAIK